MKKQLILLLFFIALVLGSEAKDNEYYYSLALQGNEQYADGNYDSALTLYSTVVNSDFASANLFYNLGSTYFKLNQLAPSIYYLEKAQKLAPFDKDIAFNLSMANDQISDRIKDVPTPILGKSAAFIRNLLSIDAWAVLGTLSFLLFISLIGFYLLSNSISLKKMAFFLSIGFLLATIGTLTLGFSALNYVQSENQAIVFSGSLSVKSEPKQSSSNLFIVHEGTRVSVLEEVNNWVRISLPDGNEGWAPLEELKRY